MAGKIDWSGPLEAYHSDGTVIVIECEVFRSGEQWGLRKALPGPHGGFDTFNADGSPWRQKNPWRIRNRKSTESKPSEGVTPELVERMAKFVREYRDVRADADRMTTEYEAATKPPVDPLVEAISEAIGTHITPGAPWDNLPAELAKRGLTITKADAS